MNDIVFYVWLLTVLIAGFNIILIIDRDKKIFGIESLGIAFLLGTGAISAEMFIMGSFGLSFNRNIIMAPWFVLTVYNLSALKGRIAERFFTQTRDALNVIQKILIGLISIQVIYTFFKALIKPMESYDSVAIYGLKAKMLYLFGGIPDGFYGYMARNFHGIHPDYPLLVSLSETWMAVFSGGFDDFLLKWIFPLTFLSFLLVFYALLRKITDNKTQSLAIVFFISTVSQFNNYAANGYTDMHLAVFFSLSLIYLILWLNEGGNAVYLFLSVIFSLFAVLTKNEGTALAFINILVAFVIMIRERGKKEINTMLMTLFYIVTVAGLAGLWMAYKHSLGLVNDNFDISMVNRNEVILGVKRIPAILYEYQKNIFQLKKWNLAWVIIPAVVIYGRRRSWTGSAGYLGLSVILFFVFYTMVYMLLKSDFNWLLNKTCSRFFIHILPVTAFWAAYILREDSLGK